MTGLLGVVVSHSEVSADWLSILDWRGFILLPPNHGGKCRNLASTKMKCICLFSCSPQSVGPVVASSSKRLSESAVLAQAIAAKLEGGNGLIRAANHILCSKDTPALPSAETLYKLQEKQSYLAQGSLAVPFVDSALQVVVSDAWKVVLSLFPAGSLTGRGIMAFALNI